MGGLVGWWVHTRASMKARTHMHARVVTHRVQRERDLVHVVEDGRVRGVTDRPAWVVEPALVVVDENVALIGALCHPLPGAANALQLVPACGNACEGRAVWWMSEWWWIMGGGSVDGSVDIVRTLI